jgi:hypothetical protein
MNPDAISEEEKVAVKEYKNDLFKDVLPALDRQDKKYYSTLIDAQKKDISIWLLTRYMSAAGNRPAGQLYTVNETVNKRSSLLTSNKTENSLTTGRHKELQWMLLAITGTGRRESHRLPATPRGIKKTPLVEVLVSRYPLMKDDDIELLLELNTNEEIKSFLKDNGYDDKTIKELFKGEEKTKAK